MATQGIVSVVVNGKTVVKAVAGSDGYKANLLAAEIRRDSLVNPDDIFAAAKRLGFGCQENLVVQEPGRNIFEGHEDLAGLYLDPVKFADARFNPRWEHGTAYHTEVVEFPA
jgi:hypothetical protein